VQKKMFDSMFSTKPIGKGTGLGLSISRSIIEKHQGVLRVNNNSANTCFEIVLPKKLKLISAA
jgi:signal transduction histidine kinase